MNGIDAVFSIWRSAPGSTVSVGRKRTAFSFSLYILSLASEGSQQEERRNDDRDDDDRHCHRLAAPAPALLREAKFDDVGPERFVQAKIGRPGCGVRSGVHQLDRGDESIAAPGNGLNVKGPLRLVVERLAHLFHGKIDALVEIDECVALPQRGANLLACNDPPGPGGEQLQKTVGLRL